MFKNGIKDCAIILAISLVVGILGSFLIDIEIGISIGALVFMVSAVFLGTKYRKRYGPLFFSTDGKAINRLFQYSLGFGVLVGFPLIFITSYWGEKFNLFASIIVAIIAIPFWGMNMIGCFALGRSMNRNIDD